MRPNIASNRSDCSVLVGKPVLGPPRYEEAGDSYSADHVVAPLSDPPFWWEPEYFLAICRVE